MEGRELLVLRHGKSSWDSGAAVDLDRPLAGRGKRDAPRMGAWLVARGLVPDLILSSPAKRALQTARRVAKAIDREPDSIVSDERIYYGGHRDVLEILGECHPDLRRVLVVGHNPTLESLVTFLAGAGAEEFKADKFFPTCALAWLQMPEDWTSLESAAGDLRRLVRPKTLAD